MPVQTTVCAAQLNQPAHRAGILELLNLYAIEPSVGGQPLSDEVQANLIPRLGEQANGRYFLAFQGDKAVGVAICFVGFSTFRAQPVVNLHDLAVHPDCRDRGIGQSLLQAVENEATKLGCCAITLEVKENNRARKFYQRFGFGDGGPDGGASLFMAKRLC